MRRRFGRTRRNTRAGDAKNAPIDAARTFERLAAAGIADADSFEAVAAEEIAASFAAVATAERDGRRLVVGFAPRNAGDAALATIAVAQRLAAEAGFDGEAIAVAPQWSAAARRRLGALRTSALPFAFRAMADSTLADGAGEVIPEAEAGAAGLTAAQIAARLPRAVDREVFLRAAAALAGLAAKHGGSIRGLESRLELVLLARCVAALHASDEGARLETFEGDRSNQPLAADGLATAMDRLEGFLRKQLNDRRAKDGEEGLRAQLALPLAEIAGIRHAKLWPVAGSDGEVVDVVGVHDDGRPIVGAIREKLDLSLLARILDAALVLRPVFPVLLADAGPPLRLGSPRLVVAAKSFDAAALRVLASLALDHVAFDIDLRRGRDPVLALRAGAPEPERAEAGERTGEAAPEGGRPRTRGRRGGRRSRAPEGAAERELDRDLGREREPERDREPEPDTGSGFDEVSLFDLADEQRADEGPDDGDGRRPRRGRGRGRRRRSGGRASGGDDDAEGGPAESPPDDGDEATEVSAESTSEGPRRRSRGRGRGRRAAAPAAEADGEGDDFDRAADSDELSEGLAPLEELPELGEMPQPVYDDEEEEDEGEDDLARRRREAELRARAAGFEEASAEPEETLKMPRKRAAIVVHADRASVICGVLLARDLRQLEGLWVYGQHDLMTFFRGVATDLPEDTPIYVVGFTASPARDAIATASLYRGRLAWFDHHEWPPEDLGAMADAIGREHLHVVPGTESSLSEVLSVRQRRSRFSDKIVELANGCFSQHDYDRWGRLWWHRLAEIAQRSGDRRADLDALLTGRPSDLAKEAQRAPVPPEPAEVAFVTERDFRLVHFHGFTLVVVSTPPELDLHLTARIARERFDAEVSVARYVDGDLVVLGSDEGRGRRGLDLSGMVSHLGAKHEWVVPLPDEDHVARLRIRDLAAHPDRFDELISEIAMGRSILEG